MRRGTRPANATRDPLSPRFELILGPARSNAERYQDRIEQRRLAMIRFLLRTLGLVFLAAAFIFLVIDGTKSIAANALFPPLLTPLNETWTQLHEVVHAPSLQQLQPAIEQVSPWLWDPLTLAVLNAPTFAVIGAIGVILVVLGRRRKPLIGYAR